MNVNPKILIILAALSLFASSSYRHIDSLKNKIEKIVETKNAVVGVSICGLENEKSLNINGENLRLNQEIFISKSELLPQ